ncbi:MarR family transcriptional regulator [Pantoea sp. Mb-10]|uniref:MarR family winged helix-turn-helix transcriptional regulator n=1 Tax=unclassified Pantoea TaxID=2630326 RepID=UPI001E3C9188|nr:MULTISPECIES: MarR family transcriptional regulator [unclassified Pantoea]MCE0490847.1 MarR family transcriptional regulator [Pantoea sp. Mb-10]MCE0499995.1 MarR family transcriptional regulator [Pantoea sp. Pb-8]
MKHGNDINEEPHVPAQKLDKQLCFALYSASLAMTKLYQPYLKPFGLTYAQYLTLLVLWEKDGITVSGVGQRLQLDSGTLSHLLKRLEQAGFICRTRDVGQDERRVIIRLTDAGRALESRIAGISQEMICAVGISLETLNSLRDEVRHVQQKILQAVSQQRDNASCR